MDNTIRRHASDHGLYSHAGMDKGKDPAFCINPRCDGACAGDECRRAQCAFALLDRDRIAAWPSPGFYFGRAQHPTVRQPEAQFHLQNHGWAAWTQRPQKQCRKNNHRRSLIAMPIQLMSALRKGKLELVRRGVAISSRQSALAAAFD